MRVCANGHEVGRQDRFCAECGQPVDADTRRQLWRWVVPAVVLVVAAGVAGAFALAGQRSAPEQAVSTPSTTGPTSSVVTAPPTTSSPLGDAETAAAFVVAVNNGDQATAALYGTPKGIAELEDLRVTRGPLRPDMEHCHDPKPTDSPFPEDGAVRTCQEYDAAVGLDVYLVPTPSGGWQVIGARFYHGE